MRGTPRIFAGDPAGLSSGQPAPVVAGDSFVAAVEFAAPPRARVLMPDGKATQPGSPHTGDQLALLAREGVRPAWRTREAVRGHLEAVTPLPARRERHGKGAATE